MSGDRLYEWAEVLKVVAHPVRLMILQELQEGRKCVNDMTDLLEVKQPNMSQHLLLLRRVGLVDFEQDGVSRCYYLTRSKWVGALFRGLDRDYPEVKAKSAGRGSFGRK